MIQAVESVRRQIVVGCSQRRAFEPRDLDRFGADADRMRQTFDAPGAWDATLAAFAAVAQTRA